MKIKSWVYFSLVLLSLGISSCEEKAVSSEQIKKKKSVSTPKSKFKEVEIGKQIWMLENLNVSKFRNGDIIPEAQTVDEWKKASENKQPAWCYYNNDSSRGEKYGRLYNWYTVNDPRGLAPNGWHIPSIEEWELMFKYIDPSSKGIESTDSDVGKKMKSTTDWDCWPYSPVEEGYSCNGNNQSGFSGLPGGCRTAISSFNGLNYIGTWWSSTEHKTTNAWTVGLICALEIVSIEKSEKSLGFSVRCIKD
jgi:uncharacterized protein (TIGR02145 family)